MRSFLSMLTLLAAAVTTGRCRTIFPYIAHGNRYSVRTTVPMDFPLRVPFLRVHAANDVPEEVRGVLQYSVVRANNRKLPFGITEKGELHLVRQVEFTRAKKDSRRYRFNIIAGAEYERGDARAILAVEVIITRSSLNCSALTDQELCWGPWEFLSGLQWFEDPLQGPATDDPLRVDFRSPAHVLCGAPEYHFTAERAKDGVPGDWTAPVSEPTSDGSAVSLAHLGLPSRQELRLTVTCSRAAAVPGQARKEDEAPFRKKIDAQNKTLPVDVLDRNNHPPEMNQKDSVFDIYLCETHNLFKDEHVSNKRGRPRISIVDMDEHHASHYKVHIEGDTAGILALDSPTPGIFDLPPGSYPDIQRTASMLFANLKYRRNASPYKEFGPGYNYSVQVVFEDKFLHHSYGDKELRMTVNLLTSCRPPPPTSPPPEVVTVPAGTIFSAAVRRDSARFARVFQLPRELLAGPLHLAPTPDRAHRAFNVTEREGIVYVLKPSRLRELSGVVNLTLLSREGDKNDAPVTVNVTVSVNVTAVTGESDGEAECEQKKNADHCAVESTEKECQQRCGAGAQGRCAWRPPPEGKEEMTNEYGTCSPDFRTCPDQRCDELESLWPQICPQDCVARDDRRNGSPLLKYGTHRGVARGRGVCHCEQFTSCTCATGEHVPRPSDRNMTERQRARATVATPRSELAASPEKRVCGTACITGSSLGAVLLLAMMLLVCLIYDSRCGRSSKLRKDPFGGEVISLSHITGDMDLGGRQQMALPPDAQCAISAQLLETVPVDDKWEFPRRRLVLGELLGEGEFGKVLKGQAMGIAGDSGCRQVAVKMLKPSSTTAELQDLLSEYNLLKEVNHPNVIRLLGACTGPGGPVCIIMEFAELGCLRTYLCNSRKSTLASGDTDSACAITPKELISYAWQISRGMSYLVEMKLVHRDLAARNVLLAEGKVCKISDFGLTRDIYEGSLYQKTSKGRVPVKWMAIESLEDHVYTSKSDVWSFGVLLWELITLGSNPYPGVTPERLCHLLKSGYRMDRPANCTQDMYSIMRQCWQEQPSSRPTFSELSQWFDRMLQSGSEYLDLSTPLVLNREYFDLLSDGDDLDLDRPIDYGNLHLLSSSYLPPRSQPAAEPARNNQSPLRTASNNQSPLRSASNNQSPLRYGVVDQSARKPERLTYSSLLAHGSDTEDGGARDLPLNYSSLLLPDSEPEEGEDSGSGSDNPPRETCDEQCGLMEVSV